MLPPVVNKRQHLGNKLDFFTRTQNRFVRAFLHMPSGKTLKSSLRNTVRKRAKVPPQKNYENEPKMTQKMYFFKVFRLAYVKKSAKKGVSGTG